MQVISFDFDTAHGFAWAIVDGKKEGEQMMVQCCLKAEKKISAGKSFRYVKQILARDCGHNDGICGDVNAPAFEFWGENRCMKALFQHARKAGITVE